jgi:hypothetical protein
MTRRPALLLAAAVLVAASAGTGTPLPAESPRAVQAPVWVYLETVPGSPDKEELRARMPPIQELDETARYILSGMIYGWTFTYTPSDKLRKVEEFFSLDPVDSLQQEDPRMELTEVSADYPRLTCWASIALDEALSRRRVYWDSVLFRTGSGRGYGERGDETAGIRQAYTQAIMQAIREQARKLEKNKPKEIRGEVLLKQAPRLFSESGRFGAEVRVLINMQEIIPYTTF